MITGSLVALVTPMFSDGSIDWDSLDNLLEFHIENGTAAIVIVGTTGESSTLDMAEHEQVIKYTVGKCQGRVPVIAGTGGNSTSEAIHLTAAAKRVGADAALIVTPYYNKPSQEGLYQHFKKIAESVDLPQILYNVPGRTACDMLPATVLRLAEVPNIIGIKEATGDIDRAKYLIAHVPEGFAVYSGDDATATELMLAGGHGDISVTANVSPKAMASMCAAALAGDRELAERLNMSLQPLHQQLFLEANPVPVKWALHLMGLIPDGIRLPLVPLDGQYHEAVTQAMMESGII
ncbi:MULTISPECIES: 4-hydroxy-tetrahydrodipicolinate synthase [Reinekea]|jgi:4-hydroxy-tetrahydrodipicolinate synthase|uniref:4-hydroxy-tetrahydrodipicolinate synthase n=1 Tax=Reinekea forsetii TaxID=1336806 RepID=A0A2K8KMX0_9GAMM|nr:MULTISPECIES: 4-hydroxy-tetrahydrodipicolinate synthase [Reinekea]ATX76193.1 dihydrodipicolinate synthase [Reinekea forsetii]MDO7644609.1 4-hydroxy-tetrahydrodipicolinate synthase [Reinekea forsetii]